MPDFAEAATRGRVLVQNHDATVVHDAPFVLACTCEGAALDLAIRRVSLFAFSLSIIIATIVALRAAPLPIIAIAIVWFTPAAIARIFAARRRREQGRFLIDFESEQVTRTHGEAIESIPIAGTFVEIVRAFDASVPYWLILRNDKVPAWRIARGSAVELRGVLRVFREYHVEVRGKLEDPEASDD
jgi:hypothetical protein